jgi:hypothetical protein
LEVVVEPTWRFGLGERVSLIRDLPSLPARTVGVVRGVSANSNGVSYAIRFDSQTRVVSEPDLDPKAKPLR